MNDTTAPGSYRVAADELRSFIERIERLDAEKKDIADQQKEHMPLPFTRSRQPPCIKSVEAMQGKRIAFSREGAAKKLVIRYIFCVDKGNGKAG